MTARGLVLPLLLLCAPASARAAGRLLSATGALTSEGAALKPGDELPNEEIRLASGTATIAIDGGRFLVTGPALFTPRKSYFRLHLGGLLVALKHGLNKRFSVRTPSVVAAVRGTDFFVQVGPKKEVDVCICRGALSVKGKMDTLPMASDNHLNYRFWTVKTGVAREKSPRVGHTDEELETLRALLAAETPKP